MSCKRDGRGGWVCHDCPTEQTPAVMPCPACEGAGASPDVDCPHCERGDWQITSCPRDHAREAWAILNAMSRSEKGRYPVGSAWNDQTLFFQHAVEYAEETLETAQQMIAENAKQSRAGR